MLKNLTDKLGSGRWILTVMSGIVFVYCAIKSKLDSDCITAIVSMVFVSYFQRQDRNGNGKDDDKTNPNNK